jgi:hypothetical protein
MPTVPIFRTSSGPGIVFVVLLEEQQNQPISRQRPVDGFDGHRTVDRKRLQRQRKGDRTSEGKDGDFGRKSRMGLIGQAELSLSSYQLSY